MKFIYFDVGGVLMNDFSCTDKWERMIGEWSVTADKISAVKGRLKVFTEEVCVGRNIDEFLPILKDEFGIELEDGHSINMDFVKLYERNEGIWEIIKNCEGKYKMGLLTGMYPGLLDLIYKNNLLSKSNWDILIDSSVVKMTKPNEDIYLLAQEKAGVETSEILFIDNVDKNLDVPKKLGWKTFLYDSSDYERSNEELKAFLG